MSKTNFFKKVAGKEGWRGIRGRLPRMNYATAAGIGALGGAGMAWWQGNSILSGAFYGVLGGLGANHFGGTVLNSLAKQVPKIRNSPDSPEWLQNMATKNFATSLRYPNLRTRQGVALIGGGLAGGMFSTHNGHRRKTAGFNSRRGNYIGA